MTEPCTLCRRPRKTAWHLTNYYGFTGRVCRQCYDGISHDAFGKPIHPRRYRAAVKRSCKRLADKR